MGATVRDLALCAMPRDGPSARDAGRSERFRRVKPFAELLDRLLYTPQRNAKVALLVDYFRNVPDPDRGWGLAALTGALSFAHAKPALIRELVSTRTDPVLFGWSYDFVGDLAETAALMWPEPADARPWPMLDEVVAALATTRKAELPRLVAGWLDTLDATGRWALLKLVTGGLRVGASARLAKLALAEYGRQEPAEIEEVWHGLAPPYGSPVRLAGRQRPAPRGGRGAGVPAPDAGASGRGRGRGQGGGRPRQLPRRVEMGRHPGPDRGHQRRRAALLAQRRRHLEHLPRPGRGGGVPGRPRRRAAGQARGRGRLVQRAAAAPEPQGGDGADARGLPGLRASLRHPVRRPRTTCAPCRSPQRRAAAGGVLRPRAAAAHGRLAAGARSPASTISSACAAACAARRSRG